jgi:hypothetical protein
MAITTINVGTSANDNTGDTLRNAFITTNTNFSTLTNVDNTSDANKPVSTATQTALNLKAPLASPTITGTLTTVNDAVINGVKVGKGLGNIVTNTVVGNTTLNSNTTGSYNSALGNDSLKLNTSGSYNSAFGSSSLASNTSGTDNVAIGINTFINNLTGSFNTAVGAVAGTSITTESNVTCLGYGAQANTSNQIVMGNTSVNALKCNVQTITSLSDERDKTDIVEITEGLEFINKLKPVTFTWNQRDEGRVGIKSAGFIAQDLLELQNDSLIGENLDLVSDLDPDQLEARYGNLLPVMIKAIQELTARINVLEGN